MIKIYKKHRSIHSTDSVLFRLVWRAITERKLLILSILFLLITVPIVYLTLKYQNKVEAAWYDDNFAYRQRVDITNSSGGTLTDFQISMTLDTATLITAGKMQSDCDDIRITDVNGKVLAHWIETGTNACNTTTTAIWTKAPSISTTGTTVFVYYGNPSATSTQNGDNVFLFFDDFSGSAINTNKWTIDDSTGFSVGSGELTGTNTTGRIRSTTSFSTPFLMASRNIVTAMASNGHETLGTYISSSDAFGGFLPHSDTSGYTRIDSSWTNFNPSPITFSSYHVDKVYGANGTSMYVKMEQGANSYTGGPYTNTVSNEPIALGRRYDECCTAQSYNARWDWIYVRKYAATEPSVASPTNEEKSVGPVAYWKFDEGYADTTYDSTTNANNGTRGGGTAAYKPTWQSEDQCVSGKCLYFDGTDDYVPAASTINIGTNDFTVQAWVKSLATGAMAIVGTVSGGGQQGFLLYTNYGGSTPYFGTWNGASTPYVNANTQTNNDSKWHYIVGVRSGTTLAIYIDGKLDNSTTTSVIDLGSGTVAPRIGAMRINPPSDTQHPFKGFIDDVKIYNYARSAAQIKSDFASKGSGSVKGTSVAMGTSVKNSDAFSNGLVGYWKMDESSTPAVDSSGNGNTGTWANSPAAITGVFGNGIDIPGVGGSGVGPVVNVSDSDSLDVGYTNSMTAAFWLKNDSNVCAAIFKKSAMWEIYRCSSALTVRFDAASPTDYSSGTSLNNGQWYHVVVTRNYQTGKTILYLNGQQDSTWTFSVGTPNTTGGIGIGAYYGGNWAIDGKLDDVRLYNRELSPKEVRDLYNWAPGPVAHYKFDEGSFGGSAVDSSGNSLTGIVTGATNDIGKFGKGARFNGTSNSVVTTDNALLRITAYSVSAWIKPEVDDDFWTGIVGKPGRNYNMWFGSSNSSSGYIHHRFHDSAGGNSGCPDASGVPINGSTWTYITITNDGTTCKTYFNGVLQQQGSVTGSLIVDNSDLQIGRNLDGGASNYFRGIIDDVRIYNYARTAKQIVEDMNAGHPSGGSPVGSQYLYYKFDEGYGTSTSKDSGPNGLDASLTGTSWSNNGKFNKAIVFNGSARTTNASFSTPGAFTVSAWINHNISSGYKWVLGKENSFTIGIGPNTFYGYVRDGTTGGTDGNGWNNCSSSTAISTNAWHYVALIYNNRSQKIYLDGQLLNSCTFSPVGDSDGIADAGSGNFTVGDLGTRGVYFVGTIDEVKVYSGELSSDEIKLDYNRGSAMVLGALSDTSGLTGGSVASSSAQAEYCIPGDTTSCNSPVAEWKFDEKTGTNAYDTSGNGLATSAFVGQTTWGIGKIGSALYTDGNGDSAYRNDTTGSPLDLTTLTINFWFKVTQLNSNWKAVITKGDTGTDANNNYECWINTSNSFYCEIGNGSTSQATSSFSVVADTWYFVSFVVDGSYLRLYKNGVPLTPVGQTITPLANDNRLTINGLSSGSYSVPGYIDNLQIFNYARSAAQIAWDYNRGAPLGWWKMDECQGGTIYDTSGNSLNGNITINTGSTQDGIGTCADGDNTNARYNGRNGKYSSSLNFDGYDDVATVTSATGGILNPANAISLSAWIYINSSKSSSYFVTKGWGDNYEMYLNGSNQVVFRIINTPSPADLQSVTSTIALSNSQWYHIVGTYDQQYLKLYINGQYNNQAAYTKTIYQGSQKFAIGGIPHMETSYFNNGINGQVDDVRVYNYALTATQVKNLYNEGSAVRFGPSSGSP